MSVLTQTDHGPADITQVSLSSLLQLAQPARKLSLRRSRIRSRQNDAYRSRFKGRGMEYDESRPYQPGDDIRHLDWRVMARTGKAHTKLFCEERERPVYLWLDCRAPMFFATRGCYKFVLGAKLASLLAWSAGHEGDRVGGIIFSEADHHEIKPRRGRAGVLPLLHQLADLSNQVENADSVTTEKSSASALLRLAYMARPGSMIFLISDFKRLGVDMNVAIRNLAAHSEVVMIQVYDPVEADLPPPGEYQVCDGKNNLRMDTTDQQFNQTYVQMFHKHQMSLQSLAHKLRIGLIDCRTFEDPFAVLSQRFGTY